MDREFVSADTGEQPGGQPVVKAAARIDWRKLAVPSLLIMMLPTIAAVLLDVRLGTLPLLTIFAIVICFPLATFLVIRVSLQEMDRVIAEVAPPLEWEPEPQGEVLPRLLPEDGKPPDSERGTAAEP